MLLTGVDLISALSWRLLLLLLLLLMLVDCWFKNYSGRLLLSVRLARCMMLSRLLTWLIFEMSLASVWHLRKVRVLCIFLHRLLLLILLAHGVGVRLRA